VNKSLKLLLIITFFSLVGCEEKQDKIPSRRPQKTQSDFFTVDYDSKPYTLGEFIEFKITNLDKKNTIDSIEIFSGQHLLQRFKRLKRNISTKILLLGKNIYSFKVHFSDNSTQIKTKSIEIWGNKTPEKLEYKIINTFSHDRGGYTQGLQFHKGFLYESTGQFGKSSIRKVNISNGEIIERENLPAHQFGEGMTIVNDKIYQLTWKSFSGYIYDLNSLTKTKSFYYPAQLEGWGLTFNGEQLIMSDGSDCLFFWNQPDINSSHFIKVADNNKTYNNLNELEYVGGFVYANIYLQNTILKINTKSGEVVASIDFSSLLSFEDKMSLKNPSGEVLNGIAYNPEKQTFYITGKDWPKLFEVKIF